jgi:hypothetical protein
LLWIVSRNLDSHPYFFRSLFRHTVSLKMELALAAGVRCEQLFPQPQNRSQITRFMLISQIISLIQRWN